MKLTNAQVVASQPSASGGNLRQRPVRSSRRPLSLGCMLMLAAIYALSASGGAQHAGAQVMVQTGNALDANNQVGSGGSNAPIPGYVPMNPNAVGYANSNTGMYNSVPRVNYQVVPVPLPGGGTSYARIPQLGQSSFGTNVAPSAVPLYNVNAISSGVPSSAVNSALGSQGLMNSQGALVQTPVGGNPYSPYAVNGQAYMNPAFMSPYNSQNPAALMPGTGVSAYTTPGSSAVPMGTTTGVVGQISPLFGLRQVSVQQPISGQLTNPFGLTSQSDKVSGLESQSPTGNSFNSLTPINVGTSQAANGQAINGNVNHVKTSRPTGEAINGSVNNGNQPGKINGGGLYQQLLTELAGGKATSITAPGLPGKPAMTMTDLTPKSNHAMLTIDPITGLPIAPITSKRLIGVSNGIGQGSGINTSIGPTGTIVPSGIGTNGNISNTLTNQLQAGRSLATLNSLAGGTPGNFGQLMRQAEADQKTGRFVSAIENYQSAIQLQPGNALPLVGQANAELAAGLYQSAAYNLKFVFGRHPELTALHYDFKTLLPAASLQVSHRQLRRMFTQKSDLAAFLLAYVDYQTGRSVELKSTLNQWANWKNSGPWPTILQKAWIKAANAKAAGPAKAEKP